MLLYNVTVHLDPAVHEDWLRWMLEVHVPEVMATGFFSESKVLRLLEPESEDGGTTYTVQYFCENMDALQRYRQECAPALQAAHSERYAGRFAAFRTVLEVVERRQP